MQDSQLLPSSLKLLSQEQLADLRELSRHRGWGSLRRLLEGMEQQAQDQLNASTDRDVAWERLQFLHGLQRLTEIIRHLYSETRLPTDEAPTEIRAQEWGRNRERVGTAERDTSLERAGITVPTNPADTEPTGPSY